MTLFLDAGEDPEEASQAKKKEKKKKTITLTEGRTIEKNINNIRISSYDLSFDVDPMVKVWTIFTFLII